MTTKFKYIAVSPSWQWCCKDCNTDMRPTLVTIHSAKIRKSGPARMYGPKPISIPDANQEIYSVDKKPMESYLECSDCGNNYVAQPVGDSAAELIREEGVEELTLELANGLEIHAFVPGEDGRLYGDSDVDGFAPRNMFWGVGLQKNKKKGDDNVGIWPLMKNDSLIWSFNVGLTLDNFRFSEDLQTMLTRPCRIAAGKEDISPYMAANDAIRQDLVTWIREDLIELEADYILKHYVNSLVKYHRNAIWWKQNSVSHLDIPNYGKHHEGGFGLVDGLAPPAPMAFAAKVAPPADVDFAAGAGEEADGPGFDEPQG